MKRSSVSILGDSLEHMKTMPDNYYHLAICDPPYGVNANAHRRNRTRTKLAVAKHYDTELWNQEVPSQEFFNELVRVSRHQIIFGINYLSVARSIPNDKGGRIVWDKVNYKSNFSNAEIASCSKISSVRIFQFMWNGMNQGLSFRDGRTMQGNKELNEKRIHPTQKPVELYKYLLSEFCKPGHKVLDTHLGSGSSRIAADMYGVHFSGIGILENHFYDQEKRWQKYLKATTRQMSLKFK